MSLRLSRASNRIRIAKQKIINYLCEGNRAINDVDRIEHYYNLQSAIICNRAIFWLFSGAAKCHQRNHCASLFAALAFATILLLIMWAEASALSGQRQMRHYPAKRRGLTTSALRLSNRS